MAVRGLVRLSLGLAAGATLMACTSPPRSEPFGIYGQDWNQDLARLVGRLELRDGCLVVRVAEDVVALGFGREGTSWDAARGEVHIDNQSFRVGEVIRFGGGSPGPANEVDWLEPPPESCAGLPVFFVRRP